MGKLTSNAALMSPETVVKDIQAQGVFNINDFLSKLNETSDIKEKVLKEVVDKLFDKDNLLMIARLDNTMAFYIIKHLIINNFYAEFYYHCEVKYHFKGVKDAPYYRVDVEYHYPDTETILKKSYKKLIDELLAVTISFQGKGRDELIRLYDSVNREIRLEQQGGFLKNFGLQKQ